MKFEIEKNINLQPYNTFGFPIIAKEYIRIESEDQLKNIFENHDKNTSLFILNGGSNILFTKNTLEKVLHIQNKGISTVSQTQSEIIIEANSAENWDEFVAYTVQNNWGGLENLSLIPGNVGASPIQNIGAYGVEMKDCFYSLKAFNLESLQFEIFNKKDCEFGYRNSYFKNKGKGKYIIVSVQFQLKKHPHILHKSYGSIENILNEKSIIEPTIKDIRDAVIQIRTEKLPDPKEIGNAGSFFKNPVVSSESLKKIQTKHTDIPFYALDNKQIKIPAAWLIEKLGWKGKKVGNVGVHDKQALVLVHYGNGTGQEILNLAQQIIDSIKKEFGILLEKEVNII